MQSLQFSKNFPLPKNGGHFEFSNFCQKWQNTNMLLSPYPCEIERFCRNFRPTGYLSIVLLVIFKKFSPPQKWRPFRIFEFLPKMAKHKFASISLTVRDRAISSPCEIERFRQNFRPTGYLTILLLPIFKKFSPPQKWRPF